MPFNPELKSWSKTYVHIPIHTGITSPTISYASISSFQFYYPTGQLYLLVFLLIKVKLTSAPTCDYFSTNSWLFWYFISAAFCVQFSSSELNERLAGLSQITNTYPHTHKAHSSLELDTENASLIALVQKFTYKFIYFYLIISWLTFSKANFKLHLNTTQSARTQRQTRTKLFVLESIETTQVM